MKPQTPDNEVARLRELFNEATDLIADIMWDEVNAIDECEKWLRAYAPERLNQLAPPPAPEEPDIHRLRNAQLRRIAQLAIDNCECASDCGSHWGDHCDCSRLEINEKLQKQLNELTR